MLFYFDRKNGVGQPNTRDGFLVSLHISHFPLASARPYPSVQRAARICRDVDSIVQIPNVPVCGNKIRQDSVSRKRRAYVNPIRIVYGTLKKYAVRAAASAFDINRYVWIPLSVERGTCFCLTSFRIYYFYHWKHFDFFPPIMQFHVRRHRRKAIESVKVHVFQAGTSISFSTLRSPFEHVRKTHSASNVQPLVQWRAGFSWKHAFKHGRKAAWNWFRVISCFD